MTEIAQPEPFLFGGGDMGSRIRAYPWHTTELGEPSTWPQGLRTAVRVLLTTQHPIFIFWGEHHRCFYNDAYAKSLGPEKHPAMLGANGRDAWAEIWPIIGPQLEQVLRGDGATWHEDHLVPIHRHGAIEDVYWTYSYSPIDDPRSPSGVGGVLVICTETTKQVLAQQRLRDDRERFIRLFDHAPSFLAVLEGPEHVFRMTNRMYVDVVGGRSVVGLRLADALPEAVEQGYQAVLDQVYRTGVAYSARGARFARAPIPGQPIEDRFVDFVYEPIRDDTGAVSGILVQGIDVTDRTHADLALSTQRGRIDYATRVAGIGYWYCDLPFDVLEWDERVKEHFFLAPDARVTIDEFYARIHDDDRESTRLAIAQSIDNRSVYDVTYRTVNPLTGELNWIRALGGADYAADGSPTRFDGVTVDVSDEHRHQQHLSVLNARLQEQDRRKDEFIATLSHELRGPLAPIRTAATLLVDPGASADQVLRARRIVERQTRNMSLLLDDLLDLARITQGKLRMRFSTVPLQDVIDAAIESVRPLLDERLQHIVVRIPQDPIIVEADPLRLSQILSNLLTNAIKFSAPRDDIVLAIEIETTTLTISVEDSGIGLAAESLAGVFDMFMQVGGAASHGGGLGIGLALVKGLTELHGGTVEARSKGLGLGSEFLVRLPHRVGMDTAAAKSEMTTPTTTTLRMLVVDDNIDSAESLGMLLAANGHQVHCAHTGAEALQLARRVHPDAAVIDLGLPDMGGEAVARALRADGDNENVVLIALTGWGRDVDRQRTRDAGFDHHFVKPADLTTLQRAIRAGRNRD